MTLLNRQLILSGHRLLDSLVTIGTSGSLARGEFGTRKIRGYRRDWLELETGR